MNILIDSGSAPHNNHGDNAMLVAAVDRLLEMWPHASFDVISTDPRRLTQLLPGIRARGVAPTRLVSRLGAIGRLVARGRLSAAWSRSIQPYDRRALGRAALVLAAGGGYLRDRFGRHATRTLLLMDEASSRGVPTAIMGQGPGVLTRERLQLARDVVPRLDLLAVRQGRTAPVLLRDWGARADRLHVTGDDAIGLAYRLRPAVLGSGIGVNLRVNRHSALGDTVLAHLRDVVGGVAVDSGTMLVPVPISFSHRNRDPETCRRVIGRAPWEDPADVLESGFHPPSAVIRNVGACRVVITGSYHGAVFALAQGVSALCVSGSDYYDDKFAGLQEAFGKEGCVIVRSDEIGFPDRLRDTMQRLWKDAARARDGLLERAAAQSRAAEEAYRSLASMVEGHPGRGSAARKRRGVECLQA